MRNFLHQYPLHSFLLTFFMSFFLFAQNTELIQLFMMKRTFIVGTIIALMIFCLVYFFIREKTKSGIITTLILFALFYYGVVYDFLEGLYYKGFWPFHNIHRYTIILILLYSISVVWFVNKKIIFGNKINYFLNILITSLLLFNVSKIIYKKAVFIESKKYFKEEHHVVSNANFPNIYYMVLDGYANQQVLKKYYGFDNSEFINFLKQKHFFVADSSFSNYYSTSPSLSSTLNMEYHNEKINENYLEKIRTNKVLDVLKRRGYKTYRLQSGYAVTSGLSQIDSVITISAPNEFERSILKYSICRLDDLFGFIPFYRLKSQIANLHSVVNLQFNGPKFVFIHIVAPHPPYVFDEYGNRSFSKKNGDNSWEPKSNYVSQLKYFNGVTKKFINYTLNKDKNSVFILQSDHGPWITSQNPNEVFHARSMILNAMYFKDTLQYKMLYKTISSVNTFRAVFKAHLDSSVTLINDKESGKKDLLNSHVFKDKVIN